MIRKDYTSCSNATELFVRAMQNAIITLLENEQLTHSLEVGNYIYHSRLSKALIDEAKPNKVFHAAMEIERYCQERQDCEGFLFRIFCQEITIAIFNHGLRIHKCKLHNYLQAFKRSKKKLTH